MSNTISSKAKIGVPGKKHTFNFNNFHESTTGFMMPNMPFNKLIDDGKCTLEMNFDDFTRLSPMPIPTMGQAAIKIAWYFVPRRVIFGRINEFKTNTVVIGLKDDDLFINNVPNFDYNDFMDWFVDPDNKLCDGVYNTATPPALITITSSNYGTYFGANATNPQDFIWNNHAYKFTYKGMQVKTIFEQCGYAIGAKLNKDYQNINAEKLLAFCKVMIDHYIPRYWEGYVNNFTNLINIMENIEKYSGQDIGTGWFNEFGELCNIICFNDDYFNVAWQSIGGPNFGSQLNPPYINGTNGHNIIAGYDNATPPNTLAALQIVNNSGYTVSQQDLNTLKALDIYMKKNQIVGTKYWDRLLAHFGITTAKALLFVSEKIKEDTFPIQFSEVVSNAETKNGAVGDNLGSYAGQGKAWIPNVCHFKYDIDEPGYVIAIKSIVPDIAYSNNFDADAFKLHRLDFYNEEFDAMGAEPIHSAELYSGYDMLNSDSMTTIFGFLPRYAWLKSCMNKVSGKFSSPALRAEFEKWTFNRWFLKGSFSKPNSDYLVQTSAWFGVGNQSWEDWEDMGHSQFDRIFYVAREHNFHSYTAFSWSLKSHYKPLFSYEDIIDDDDKQITVQEGNKND